MDKCLDCGRLHQHCRCEEQVEREVMDVHTFVIERRGFAIRATAR